MCLMPINCKRGHDIFSNNITNNNVKFKSRNIAVIIYYSQYIIAAILRLFLSFIKPFMKLQVKFKILLYGYLLTPLDFHLFLLVSLASL